MKKLLVFCFCVVTIISIIGCKTDSENQISTETEIEVYVLQLFEGENTTNENAKKIIDALPEMNWHKYCDIASFEETEQLLNWLDNKNITDEKELTNILKSTKGLDGAFAEQYAAIVGDLFRKDKEFFIKSMSNLAEEQMMKIAQFVAYNCDYFDLKNIVDDTKRYLKSDHLSSKEQLSIDKLLEQFKAYYEGER